MYKGMISGSRTWSHLRISKSNHYPSWGPMRMCNGLLVSCLITSWCKAGQKAKDFSLFNIVAPFDEDSRINSIYWVRLIVHTNSKRYSTVQHVKTDIISSSI